MQEYWFFLVGGIGLLLILGAIFKWKWVMQTQGDGPSGRFIHSVFGETGYRIAMVGIGVILVGFAIGYPILLGYIAQ